MYEDTGKTMQGLTLAGLAAVAYLLSGCSPSGTSALTQAALTQETSSSSGSTLAEENGTCALVVDNATPTVGQVVTYSLQTIPFGPTITACISGAHNGTADLTCTNSGATGPSRYQTQMTLTNSDVGTETRFAQVYDATGALVCTTNTVTLTVAASSTTGTGSNPTPVGGTAVQPCYYDSFSTTPAPNLTVGGSVGLGLHSMLSSTGVTLEACWYGTIGGVPIPDCSTSDTASGAPIAMSNPATSDFGFLWNFTSTAAAGDYSLYAKIIAEPSPVPEGTPSTTGTITNTATGATQTVTAGQVVCQTQSAPLTFTVSQ